MAPADLAGDQNKICSFSTSWALNVPTPSPLVLCRMLQRPKCFWTRSTRVQQQVLADDSPRPQGNVEINTTMRCVGFWLQFFSLCCIGRKTKRGKKKSQDGCRKLPACAGLTILQGPQEEEEEEKENQLSPRADEFISPCT